MTIVPITRPSASAVTRPTTSVSSASAVGLKPQMKRPLSLAGLVPMPHDPIYTLTKHAVVGYVRAIAPHLAERRIRINAVCPGFVDTPIVTDELRAWVESQGIPLIQPDRVAEAVLAAARSDETGQAWVVQPGREPLNYEFRGVPGPR